MNTSDVSYCREKWIRGNERIRYRNNWINNKPPENQNCSRPHLQFFVAKRTPIYELQTRKREIQLQTIILRMIHPQINIISYKFNKFYPGKVIYQQRKVIYWARTNSYSILKESIMSISVRGSNKIKANIVDNSWGELPASLNQTQ